MMQGSTPYQPQQCEWIEPYPLESTAGCGDQQLPGCLYCGAHMDRMGQKGTALRRRHKDIRVAQTVQDIDSLFNDVVAELEDSGEIEL